MISSYVSGAKLANKEISNQFVNYHVVIAQSNNKPCDFFIIFSVTVAITSTLQ